MLARRRSCPFFLLLPISARVERWCRSIPTPTPTPDPHPEHPYLRVLLGEFAFLGLQAAWYWGHQEPSESEIPFTWSTWQTKVFSDRYFVFDHDRFNTNAIGHPLAGTVYYQIARGNGFGVGASFLTTVAASTLWKYFGEPNQKLSINDLIVTPAAGWVIGEATYRLGRLFADGEPNFVNCLGAALFSPVAALNDAPVCHGKRRGDAFDERGFSRRIWHRRLSSSSAPARTLLRPGTRRDARRNRLWTGRSDHQPRALSTAGRGHLHRAAWTVDRPRRALVHATADRSAGRSSTRTRSSSGATPRDYGDVIGPSGEPDGHGLLLGMGSSFDYDARSLPSLWDRTLAVGLLGPVVELAARRGRFALRATLAASYGFAQVTSLA